MNDNVKQNIKTPATWLRGFYMLMFMIIYGIAEFVTMAVVVFQFLFNLFAGKTNERLLEFGRNLSQFIYQVLLFLTYNSEEKPFPFGEWPGINKTDTDSCNKEVISGHNS